MGWLAGPTIVAGICGILVVYIYDHVVTGPHGIFASIARVALFLGSFAFVATHSLLRSFDDRTRWFRHGSKEVGVPVKSPHRIKRFW